MRFTLLCLSSLMALTFVSACAGAAEVDARPPDRLTLTGNGSRFSDTHDQGGGGSLNWLHYFSPDAVFGVGAEYQFIEDANWTFGSIRGSLSRGEPTSRFSVFGGIDYGNGDDFGRNFDYSVAVLGLSQSFTNKLYIQLEGRQIDIDTTHGNLPKLGLTYLWTPRLSTNVSYAQSVGGNLGTKLTTVRIDHYGQYLNLMAGGATGRADPIVLNVQGLQLPVRDTRQGFVGIGKTFARGEVLLLGDYLKLGDTKKVTVTLSFTAYLGSRGRAR
jgi:hypothetical protein